MGDIFDQVAAKPKGDVFDQIAPSTSTPTVDQALASVPRPAAPDMQTSALGALAPQPVQHQTPTGEMPGSFEGHPENIGEYVPATVGEMAGGAKDIAQGNIARGGHRIIGGGVNLLAPTAPFAAAAAPVATGLALLTGAAGQYAGKKTAQKFGASEDQSDLVGDLTGLAAGYGGAKAADIPKIFQKPTANITSSTYSTPGDHIAASLRPNVRIDVPAEANAAHEALTEGLADRGYSTKDFQGRNGPAVLKSGIDNAIKIQEGRAKQIIDPIRSDVVDPKILADNPELASRLDGSKKVTYGDLDNERVKMNKELRRASFYTKDPTAQAAVADPLETTQEAVNQARDLVYGHAEDVTGANARGLKQTESALLKLSDVANTTANGLSAREAKYNATPFLNRAVQSGKKLIAVKSNPISAFSAYETPGLRSPLTEFNNNMQKAFPNLKAKTATINGKVSSPEFPNYNLNLTSPVGEAVSPAQGLLNLKGGEQVPGQDLHLSPSGDLPPALQRVLPLENPGIPSEAYPGLHAPKKGK